MTGGRAASFVVLGDDLGEVGPGPSNDDIGEQLPASTARARTHADGPGRPPKGLIRTPT